MTLAESAASIFSTSETNSTTESGPVEKVFATPELFENILLLLGHRDLGNSKEDLNLSGILDLFVLNRVNKQFKDAIENSSTELQRAMMLAHDKPGAPKHPSGLKFLLQGPWGYDRYHPALPCIRADTKRPHGRTITFELRDWFTKADLGLERSDGVKLGQGHFADDSCQQSDFSEELVLESQQKLLDASMTPRFHPDASWRRMKLSSQPQKITAECKVWEHEEMDRQGGWQPSHFAVLGPQQTVGDLFDVLTGFLVRSRSDHTAAQGALREWSYKFHRVEFDLGLPLVTQNTEQVFDELKQMRARHAEMGNCGLQDGSCAFCSAARNYWRIYKELVRPSVWETFSP